MGDRLFVSNGEEATGRCRKIYNEEVNDLFGQRTSRCAYYKTKSVCIYIYIYIYILISVKAQQYFGIYNVYYLQHRATSFGFMLYRN